MVFSVNWQSNIGPGVSPGTLLFLCAVSAQRTRPLLDLWGKQVAHRAVFDRTMCFSDSWHYKDNVWCHFIFLSQWSTGQQHPLRLTSEEWVPLDFPSFFFCCLNRTHPDLERTCSAVNNETKQATKKTARLKILCLQQDNKIEQAETIFHRDTFCLSSKVKTKLRQHVWPLDGNAALRGRVYVYVSSTHWTRWLTQFLTF